MQGTMETAKRTLKGFMAELPLPFKKPEQQTPAPPTLALYKAIVEPYTKKGERQELHVQATTVEHAQKIFHKRGLRVVSIRVLRDNTPVTGVGKVSNLELAIFCKQFGQQLDSGMVPIEAIENILEESENKNFRQALSIIMKDLQKGMTVSEAFSRHPGVFDPVFLALVQSGEEAGKLPEMMEVLYRRCESAGKLQSTLKQAMIYPAILILVGSVVLLVIYWKVMPTFASMYAELGAQLPLMTRITMGISKFVARWIVLIVAGVVAAVYSFRRYCRTEKGKRVVQRYLCKWRLLREIMEKASLALVSRSMGTLVSAGQTFHKSLELGAKSASLIKHKEALLGMIEPIRKGMGLEEAIEQHYAFRQFFKTSVKVGAKTGRMEEMLRNVAEMYEAEVEARIKQLSAVIEPAIIVVIGLLVGFTVVSLYSPLFNLINMID